MMRRVAYYLYDVFIILVSLFGGMVLFYGVFGFMAWDWTDHGLLEEAALRVYRLVLLFSFIAAFFGRVSIQFKSQNRIFK